MGRLVAFLALWALLAAPAYAGPQVEHMDNAAAAQKSFASDPQGAVHAARERIAAGDLDGAVKGLELYVAAHPTEPGPYRFLGDLYFRQGRFDAAESIYKLLLASNPGDRETHNRLGTVYAVENRVDAAIAQFEASLPGTDSVPDLVALHQRRGDLPKYLASVKMLAESAHESADVQAELGQVYQAVHQPASAVAQFQRALQIDPTSLTALNGLGLAYLDMKDYARASALFNECLRNDPRNYSCLDNLGATQLESADYANAEKTIAGAYRISPERPEALVNFGYLADTRGDWKKAVAQYAKAIAVGPYSREAYIDIGLAYLNHALYPLAQQALLKGVAVAPDDGRIHYLLGRTYEAQGRSTLAAEQFKAAAESMDPDVQRIAKARLLAEHIKPSPSPTL